MEILYQFLRFCVQVISIALGLYVASAIARNIDYDVKLSLWWNLTYSAIISIAYTQFIYPWVDPWRKLPVVDIVDMRIMLPVTDVPRGESALQWTKDYRTLDAIRVRVLRTFTVLMPISVAALRDLFGTNQLDFVKPDGGRVFLARIIGFGLILSEGDTHNRQRKRLTTSFRTQNVRALHELMKLKTEVLVKNIEIADEQSADKGVDITVWASKVTLDIIGTALMSQDFNSLNVDKQPVNEAFAALLTASPGATFLFILGLMLPQIIVATLPLKSNMSVWKESKVIRGSCERALRIVKDQMAKGQAGKLDILPSIIADPLASHREVVDQMATFLAAGHETTATSISWVTHLLTIPANKHYQDRLREEIRSHPDCTDSPVALESLIWLNAICEETLRLFPAVTSTARKAIRTTSMAGIRVYPGQMISIFPWAINRNPEFWGDDAESFVPERWIDWSEDGKPIRVNNHGGASSNYCNMTFLQGNRSCIGKGFAKAELRLVIARLFGEFRISRLPGDDGSNVKPGGTLTIKPEGGLFVRLERDGS